MIHRFNPLSDPRWLEFVERHPDATVFHGPGWLQALQQTYGYEPIAYSTCSPGAHLTNAVVLCRVQSWLTGHRLVSLPFADHCEPLVDDDTDRASLFDALKREVTDRSTGGQVKYVELRPLRPEAWNAVGAVRTSTFAVHSLNLRPPIDAIYRRTHRSTIQRKILRAERERVSCEIGHSEALLHAFYQLLLLTRRRHSLPPQPMQWFKNLMATSKSHLAIHLASQDGRPIAALLTLRWGKTAVYKYGCSDARYHNLGAVPFLFWKAIQEFRAQGIETFDLGRSDCQNTGLITFKERLGATGANLIYVRDRAMRSRGRLREKATHGMERMFACMPDTLLMTTGKLLYRHIG